MKPRIYKFRGLWYCWTQLRGEPCGLGFSPADAYAQWERLHQEAA